MKACYCDVCGVQVPVAGEIPHDMKVLADVCGVEDLCSCCGKAGTAIDLKEVLLSAWRNATRRDGEEAKSAAVKQEARGELLRFREEGGLGCLGRLANRLGGGWNAMELRRLLSGELVLPTEEWEKIGETIRAMEREAESPTPTRRKRKKKEMDEDEKVDSR